MEEIERTGNEFCDNVASEPQCLCTVKQRFLCLILKVTCRSCEQPIDPMDDIYDKKPWETIQHAALTLWTITPIVFYYALARITCQIIEARIAISNKIKYLIEFVLIVVPTVLFLSVLNEYTSYVMLIFGISVLISLFVVYKRGAHLRWYTMGGRKPFLLTLNRATINLLTVVCILAVDFHSFPKHFRKTRRYGAGLMDVGIGLFVFAMGAVSRPSKHLSEFWLSLRPVAALLMLGIARTISITIANYKQDEHEYGEHLNAFFTLGLTKLFASILSGISQRPWKHVVTGLVVLGLHEFGLQLYLAKYVMDPYLPRNNLITANREGIFSLPGFIALYLLSYPIGQMLRINDIFLKHNIFIKKFARIGIVCIDLWLLVIGSIFIVSIARVTCNSGYVLWILAIALTMTFIFMIVFNLIVNSLWPVAENALLKGEAQVCDSLLHSHRITKNIVPVLLDAVNMNGLIYFILANLLTGLVNMSLEPSDRTDFESFVILTGYMLILSIVVSGLHHFGIRIS